MIFGAVVALFSLPDGQQPSNGIDYWTKGNSCSSFARVGDPAHATDHPSCKQRYGRLLRPIGPGRMLEATAMLVEGSCASITVSGRQICQHAGRKQSGMSGEGLLSVPCQHVRESPTQAVSRRP